ncbi:PREDICTED: uncharacterized protein LOC108972878 [Bactrocera latifrons]|uniref:uncharacterized protein LOC108972878 n=1 Tax=Bactrocera latifrons TaxID=174628 RepID=UPI0008DDDE07|nr:PREDICTED: uncharacterized protein LOC108972878 [Bactrocera latifrons]
MSTQLVNEHGVFLAPAELRNRINNLTKKYRQERKAVGPTGGAPSNWEFYDDIHKIIGSYKSNFTHELADESIENVSDPLDTSMAAFSLSNESGPEEAPSTSSAAIISNWLKKSKR